jgi:hypothetical protein
MRASQRTGGKPGVDDFVAHAFRRQLRLDHRANPQASVFNEPLAGHLHKRQVRGSTQGNPSGALA